MNHSGSLLLLGRLDILTRIFFKYINHLKDTDAMQHLTCNQENKSSCDLKSLYECKLNNISQ